ncbi:aldo/keto reductase [Sphingomonas morindae]|uniref:Aldo/keto reductase n=1 Tax=Sphingomonas morindae TaxID=1541170 RepID=A0ABY4XCX7_9SPHN|nr:aldo/keto reductase [Sphingomonas morindae]USI74830.1 aldo/keto reductase [Sphingomonas morindae]
MSGLGPALPRLGMGTAAIGNLYRPIGDAEAEATVAAALEAGIGYFDTAPHYGFGLAEARLGRALAGRGDVLVSTKVGRRLVPTSDPATTRHGFAEALPYEPVFDYTADGVRRSFEDSLGRLRRDRVDLLLAHDLGALTHGADHAARLREFLDGGYPAMRALRDAGLTRAIGIGVNEIAICLELIDRVELDVILLAGRYSLLDRAAAETLLPRCAARGIRVIIGGPYNSGILARPLAEADQLFFDYAPAPAPLIARARALEALCRGCGVALPAAALQFPLTHPAVACVIPGLAGAAEVAETIARMAAPIPPHLWSALQEEPA